MAIDWIDNFSIGHFLTFYIKYIKFSNLQG